MIDLARRFVAERIDEYVMKTPPGKDDLAALESLALKLENDAWEFGLRRTDFLDAVEGDSFDYVLHETEKARERNSRTREGFDWDHLPSA